MFSCCKGEEVQRLLDNTYILQDYMKSQIDINPNVNQYYIDQFYERDSNQTGFLSAQYISEIIRVVNVSERSIRIFQKLYPNRQEFDLQTYLQFIYFFNNALSIYQSITSDHILSNSVKQQQINLTIFKGLQMSQLEIQSDLLYHILHQLGPQSKTLCFDVFLSISGLVLLCMKRTGIESKYLQLHDSRVYEVVNNI
ncbi:Hypothetical_protein [Hexamita inflata]|uniref:Hypothetical_protein n=1 Tax=Hexamita inflata TaxID=28002 RepID=A0AA86P450_9EUKA|nr:Hypothetical protein HINF_LOCUS6392 [Hexamita inflata]CAI9930079.1 Hypothetical protein HINF_LOCUS17724 [Hexamita inflata]